MMTNDTNRDIGEGFRIKGINKSNKIKVVRINLL